MNDLDFTGAEKIIYHLNGAALNDFASALPISSSTASVVIRGRRSNSEARSRALK